MLNPYVLIGSVVASVALVAGAYFYGVGVGETKAKASQLTSEALVKKATESMEKVVATAIGNIEVKNVHNKQVVQREVVENVVYRDCRHTPDSLRAINNALTTGTVSSGDSKLSPTDATGG